MKLQPKDKKWLLKAALSEVPSDSLTKHVQPVNVIIGEICPANVFAYNNMITHVEYKNLDADLDKVATVVGGQGHYLIPDFLNVREHIENSMIVPRNFTKAVLPHGTAAVIVDLHEIANVWGTKDMCYMHDSGEDLPTHQLVGIPDCVPAVPGLENTGADFLTEQTGEFCGLKRVIGLMEVMNFLTVIHGESCMMDILKIAEGHGLYMQRHAPYVSRRMLSAYLCGGLNTCHETRVLDEGLERLRSVMYMDAGDSSITRNVKDIWEGVKQVKFFDHLCFYTGDRGADDILNNGHMNDVVHDTTRYGMDPVTAIKGATYNTAREIRIENLGAITPDFAANMLLMKNLEELKLGHVSYNSELVVENEKLLADIKDEGYAIEHRNSMHVKKLGVKDSRIQVPAENGTVRVDPIEYKGLLLSSTLIGCEEFPVENGYLKLNDDDPKFVTVVDRHEGHDTAALGAMCGPGMATGALASTVSHDSYDPTTVYDIVENTLLAASGLIAYEGGMCMAKDGAVLHTLQLPLAGLISLKPVEELAADNVLMKGVNRTFGLVDMENLLLRIVALALPTIPEAKMPDPRPIDVLKKEIVSPFI